MSIRRVLAFTSIRSDYDLLSGLYNKINGDSKLILGLIVSGAHLSVNYGYTVKHIEEDNLPIIARIESLLDSNEPSARIKSASILMQNCIHTVELFKPDVIVYAGDREDAMAAALIGAYLKIPTAHFFGGDHASDGNVDNPVRHAISKLSSVHFVIHERHKSRLKALGEAEDRIFLVGNPALDKFIEEPYLSKSGLLGRLNRENWSDYAIMIHHPILGCEEKAGEYFEEILLALKEKQIKTFVAYPNTDAGNKHSLSVIKKYKSDLNFTFFKNLERNIFVNLIRHAKFMVGNSSAGLLEAPFIPLGVVNVGERQRGRLAAENVVFVNQGVEDIKSGIEKVLSKDFQKCLDSVKSPYGNGNTTLKVFEILKLTNFENFKFKPEDPLLL